MRTMRGSGSIDHFVGTNGEQRVSLVVPARNEAATVGDVVTLIRRALMETAALVDEIVVMDSANGTAQVASAAGAAAYAAGAVRPDLGTHPGKGGAMWKSLFVCTGDLIVLWASHVATTPRPTACGTGSCAGHVVGAGSAGGAVRVGRYRRLGEVTLDTTAAKRLQWIRCALPGTTGAVRVVRALAIEEAPWLLTSRVLTC